MLCCKIFVDEELNLEELAAAGRVMKHAFEHDCGGIISLSRWRRCLRFECLPTWVVITVRAARVGEVN